MGSIFSLATEINEGKVRTPTDLKLTSMSTPTAACTFILTFTRESSSHAHDPAQAQQHSLDTVSNPLIWHRRTAHPNRYILAARHSNAGLIVVTALFFIATLAMMIATVLLSLFGLKLAPVANVERCSHALTGVAVSLGGVSFQFSHSEIGPGACDAFRRLTSR